MSKYAIISLTILLFLSTMTAHKYYESYTRLKVEAKINHERAKKIKEQLEAENNELLRKLEAQRADYIRLEKEYADYIDNYDFNHPVIQLQNSGVHSAGGSCGEANTRVPTTNTVNEADCAKRTRVLLEEAYAGFADILKSNDHYAREAERLNAAYTSCVSLLRP